jgi:polyhydroxybutyrate depolymerase
LANITADGGSNVNINKRFLVAFIVAFTLAGTVATDARAWTVSPTSLFPTLGTVSFYTTFTNAPNSDSRSVLVIAPRVQAAGSKAPAIVMLHYDGGTPELQANLSRVGKLAARMGYWIFLPPAINNHWSDDPAASTTDDVGFLSAMITAAVAQYPIDAARISMAGLSNGGFMTQRMACERPDLITSGVSVAANMRTSLNGQCAPGRAVPMVYVLGTADPVVPYAGEQSITSTGSFLSALDSFAFWGGVNGCTMADTATSTLPQVVADGTTVTLQHNASCTSGGEVDLYTVNGGGHAWPGGERYVSNTNPTFGKVSRNLDTTTMIGNFAKLWTTASTH